MFACVPTRTDIAGLSGSLIVLEAGCPIALTREILEWVRQHAAAVRRHTEPAASVFLRALFTLKALAATRALVFGLSNNRLDPVLHHQFKVRGTFVLRRGTFVLRYLFLVHA